MIALIKREIEDNLILFLLQVTAAAIFVAAITYSVIERQTQALKPKGISNSMFEGLVFYLPLVVSLISAAMGVTQMYTDSNRKISTLLSTLPTTRGQILTAKMAAGILGILAALLPVMLANVILLHVYHVAPVSSVYTRFFGRIFATTFILSVACYCLGLLMGRNTGKIIPVFGTLLLTLILYSIIIIKGFGLHAVVVLLLFSIASLVRIRQKFLSTPL
ncbi:MAG: hypothetical protein ACYTFW_08195 [Planctomycetota bacterium]|jgi:hypothetical protein